MRYFILLLLSLSMGSSCIFRKNEKERQAAADKQELIRADLAFSALSEAAGMKNSFLEYIDSNGILLRPQMFPITGAESIDYLISQDDSHYSISWKPKNAVISSSGDLGFTYGLYALQVRGGDSVYYGTYVNVWKRQENGSWKFVLNSGNEGVGR